MVEKVKGYFEQFGEVEIVIIRDNYQYGVVQFKLAEITNTVLSHKFHQIAYCNVQVKAGDLWDQPEFKHPAMAPDQESPSHILNALIDDCLEKNFSYLNVQNLANAAEVCVRFNGHAKKEFSKKYTTLYMPYGLKPSELSSIVKNFGAAIHFLHVHNEQNSSYDFLCAASEHCITLTNLTLMNFNITGELAEKLRPLFMTLVNLHLFGCTLDADAECLLSAYVNLRMFNLHDCVIVNGKKIAQKFEKIEEAQFSANIKLRGMIISFIKQNSTLKKLMVFRNGVDVSKLLQAVVENLPNLTHLYINEPTADRIGISNQLPALSQLTALKVVKLNFCSVTVGPLMKQLVANNVAIEHLHIIHGEIDNDAIDSISMLTKIINLKFFNIQQYFTDDRLIQLAKLLPALQQLWLQNIQSKTTTIGLKKMLMHANKLTYLKLWYINSMILIDADDYKAMLKTVQNRNQKVRLQIKLICSHDAVNIAKEILTENFDVFHISVDHL